MDRFVNEKFLGDTLWLIFESIGAISSVQGVQPIASPDLDDYVSPRKKPKKNPEPIEENVKAAKKDPWDNQ